MESITWICFSRGGKPATSGLNLVPSDTFHFACTVFKNIERCQVNIPISCFYQMIRQRCAPVTAWLQSSGAEQWLSCILDMLFLVYPGPFDFPLPDSLPASYIYFACVTLIGSCSQPLFHSSIPATHQMPNFCVSSSENTLVLFHPQSSLKSENKIAMCSKASVSKKLEYRQSKANSL